MKIKNITIVFLLMINGIVNAQDHVIAAFEEDAWEINAKNYEFVEYKGKKALYLDNGKARLKDSSFKNGIIEYDIQFEKGRNFAGVHFRIQDAMNYEEYYLRPHQSGNEDSMQYTPVINGNAGWQLYFGAGYWSAFNYKFGEWMHVKLIINDTRMDVFIDDMNTPILRVNDLKLKPQTGMLGFGTFLGAAYYANLTYQEIKNPSLYTKTVAKDITEKGTITDWQVSEAFAADRLKMVTDLKELKITSFKEITAESSGTVNLSYISPVSDTTNTVVAKFSMDSDTAQLKKLHFGYSDKVTVYVNGRPVYSGDNSFRTRDYR